MRLVGIKALGNKDSVEISSERIDACWLDPEDPEVFHPRARWRCDNRPSPATNLGG